MLKNSLIALTITAGPVLAQDCTPRHADLQTVEPGTLSVVATNYRPASWIENGDLQGIEGDILKEIAAMECLTLEARPVEAAAGLNYITRGRADLAAGGWYRTAARDEVLDFSAPLYLDQIAVVSRNEQTTLEALEGTTIGTVQGDLWVQPLKEIFGQNLKLFPNFTASLQDLRNGRIDANIASYSVVANADSAGELEGFTFKPLAADTRVPSTTQPSQVGFPMPEGSTALQAALAEDIAELRESGRLGEILQAYGLDAAAAETGSARLVE